MRYIEAAHVEPLLQDVLTQVRQNTVECLREIADYMDEIGRKAGVAKVKFIKKSCVSDKISPQVVGSGGGVLAGGLTLAGGVMTVMTAGAALPVLVAVGLVDICTWTYMDIHRSILR